MFVDESLRGALRPHWQRGQIGAGQVNERADGVHLTIPEASKAAYHDAQLTDYDPTRRDFRYQPPLRMSITAYATTSDIKGTAGFGFWNHPFVPGERGVRLPQAVWFFFGSAENDMALAQGVPGNGWKAATFNAQRAGFLALLPAAPLGVLLMNSRPLYDALWPIGQRAIGVHESALDIGLLREAHTYTLDWHKNGARFYVDGDKVLDAPDAPQKPLGFIAWVDNQYAVVTPQGRFRFGLLAVPHEQALVVQHVSIQRL